MRALFERVASLPAGRRGKWVVLGLWILVLAAAGPLAGRFESAQKNDPATFLPGDTESVRVLELEKDFPSGEATPAVVVFRREGGLTAADRAAIARTRADFARDLPAGTAPLTPPVVSADGTTALMVAPIRAEGDADLLQESVADLREVVSAHATGGLQAAVTGPAGFSADAIEVFAGINTTLLFATVLLVVVLLLIIYRSPVFWLLPLIAVLAAETIVRALGYSIAEAGVTVNGQTAGILLVLVFGAGTDYALLLTARYREELRRHEDRHEAMAMALRRAGPAVLASGGTVVAGLLCLALAEVNGTAGLGPVGAMGVAVAMVAMMTLLPALLVICGRWVFWPFIPSVGSQGADETHGFFRRLGERIARRPRPVWITTTALLLVACLGLLGLDSSLTSADDFRGNPESIQGQDLISKGFPSGASAPTIVIVGDPARAEAVREALADAPGVARVGEPERGAAGVRFDVTLTEDPYSTAAYDIIPELRERAEAAGGATALVGGPTAEEADLREASARDNRLLVPIVLIVVLLILIALLRAIVLPVLLLATVVLSYLATLGISAVVFDLVGFAGESPALPLYAFIFLVALGVDYNIFLSARVREEAIRHGTRAGFVRGLAVTGGVITSAGIVLAGTFSVLGVLPLVSLTQIGFVVAFGVLLDTLIVRSVLVPALGLDIGDPVWWPSRLARGDADGPRTSPAPAEEPVG